MIPKAVSAQRDFSGGEVDIWTRRADDNPILKASARQMKNWRILNSRALVNRPGRRLLLANEGQRLDPVVMSATNTFYLAFGNNYLRVYNEAFTKVFDSGNVMAWDIATAKDIVWDVYRNTVYITFDGTQPRTLVWDGVSQTSTWTLSLYDATTLVGNTQKRTPFYRLSPLGVTMQPAAISGTFIDVTFSAGMNLVAGHVGTRLRYAGRQVTITSVLSSTTAKINIHETLPTTLALTGPGYPATGSVLFNQVFHVGEELIGHDSGAKVLVYGITADGLTMVIQYLGYVALHEQELLVGPSGSTTFFQGVSPSTPGAITVWDDEVMNNFRGWPQSCFIDQTRFGLCDFPAVPGLIVWSALDDFTDLFTDDNNVGPTNSIQEIIPDKSRVYYVMPGPEASEFVFCDNAVHYIPITQANPLIPGSVSFTRLTSDGAARVRPRQVQQSIIYVGSGGKHINAIQSVGAYNRPYVVDDLAELHSQLIGTVIAIAAPGGSDQFEERYLYVLNLDGTLMVGRYTLAAGQIETKGVGWLPWTADYGNSVLTWISSFVGSPNVLASVAYSPGGISTVRMIEQIDADQYLDCALLINAAPAALAPPVGKGPLWFVPLGRVDLMDLTYRTLGTYQIDADGFITPNTPGEDLTGLTIVAGQAWTSTLEPFVPLTAPGEDRQQRLRRRRVAKLAVSFQNSTGFLLETLFSGDTGAQLPAAGTVMQTRRITAYKQGDSADVAPPLREGTETWRPPGRTYDPRIAIVKDIPGPIRILEIGMEATV